jgi:hypothetical protein
MLTALILKKQRCSCDHYLAFIQNWACNGFIIQTPRYTSNVSERTANHILWIPASGVPWVPFECYTSNIYRVRRRLEIAWNIQSTLVTQWAVCLQLQTLKDAQRRCLVEEILTNVMTRYLAEIDADVSGNLLTLFSIPDKPLIEISTRNISWKVKAAAA